MVNTMKWGLITGAAFLIWLCLELLLGLQGRYIAFHSLSTNLFAVPAAFFITKGILERKQGLGGRISFRRVLATGTAISLVAASLGPLCLWVFSEWINSDFFPALIRHSVTIGEHSDDGDAETRYNLQHFILVHMLAAPALGLITSLVTGLLIRNKN